MPTEVERIFCHFTDDDRYSLKLLQTYLHMHVPDTVSQITGFFAMNACVVTHTVPTETSHSARSKQ